jgi:hypothetical protein
MATNEPSVWEAQPQADMVWMRHGDGAPAQIPRPAADAWRHLGWRPCEAPPDVDPATAERDALSSPAAAPPAEAAPPAPSEPTDDAGDAGTDTEE